MFRLLRSLDPQVAPTAVSQRLGGRAVYATHISVGYLPRAVVSLRVRYGQLTRLDSHQLDCSTVGCSVFSNADFHQATIRDVAKMAGISFGTIYKYYGSKEGLLFASVDEWLGKMTDRIIDHLQGIRDLQEKLRKVFWVQLDYYEQNPGLGRILFMTVPMKTWMADETFAQRKMTGVFLDVLRQGQSEGLLNPNVRAGVLLDFMHGLVQRAFFMWVYRGQKESLSRQADMLFEMVWRAISNPELQEASVDSTIEGGSDESRSALF